MDDFAQKPPKNDLPDGYFDRLANSVFEKIEAENELENEPELPDFLKNERLKSSPFSMPKGYFETLETAIFSKIETEKSADELPDFLKNERLKISPFRAPKGFFETFEPSVFSKIELEKDSKKGRVVPLFRRLGGSKTAFAMAASMAVLVAALAFFQKEKASTEAVLAEKPAACETTKCLAEAVTEADALAFLDENLDDFEVEELADAAQIAAFEPAKKAKKKTLEALELDEKDAEFLLDELDAEDLEDLL